MQPRPLLAITASAAALSALAVAASAQNQAPFTILKPPDGATVREKVHVLVPLASIPEGGYVAYYVDGQFREGLAPSESQRANAKPGAKFDYVWDTKAPYKARMMSAATPPKDGLHEIMVRLYVPTDKSGATSLKDTSSVKVNVSNKINVGDEPIRLRYRLSDGYNFKYDRTGSTAIVAGLTEGAGGADDQELVGQRSQLLYAVEDKYSNGDAIVRNLLESLIVRQGGQETYYPTDSLPKALYQQVQPTGVVAYQNASPSLDQFAQLGVPVSATLEMPILPDDPVRVGDSWQSKGVSLDLPGTAPEKQPHVTVESKLEDVEWQGGYPTAKIHQHYEGTPNEDASGNVTMLQTVADTGGGSTRNQKTLTVGSIEVVNPKVTFDQDIFIAYRSGILVKIDHTINITGKTMQGVNLTTGAGGMGAPTGVGPGGGMPPGYAGMMGGASGSPYGGGPPGAGANMYRAMMRGGGGSPYGGMSGGGPGAPYGGGGRGMMRGGGGGMMSGGPGMMSGAGMMRGGMMPGAPGASRPPMGVTGMGPMGGGFNRGAQGTQGTQITLKSTTSTNLSGISK